MSYNFSICGSIADASERSECESEVSTRCSELENEDEKEECYSKRMARRANIQQMRGFAERRKSKMLLKKLII